MGRAILRAPQAWDGDCTAGMGSYSVNLNTLVGSPGAPGTARPTTKGGSIGDWRLPVAQGYLMRCWRGRSVNQRRQPAPGN